MPDRFPEGTPLRVAFTGPAGSGKTTHARALQEKFRGDVLSFATPLKKISRELYGDRLDDPDFARAVHQQLGVAVRHIDPQTWVELLLTKISPDRPVYVDDCRFYNEYQALKSRGFLFVRLGASMATLAERRPGMTDAQRLHESELEAAQIPGDAVISTELDIEVVASEVRDAISRLRPEVFKTHPKTAAK